MMLSPLSEQALILQRVDFIFYSILLVSIAAFIGGEVFWFLKKQREEGSAELEKRHFDKAWSLIPLLVLLFLTCVQNQMLSPTLLKSQLGANQSHLKLTKPIRPTFSEQRTSKVENENQSRGQAWSIGM